MWQDQFNLHKKGITTVDMHLLLLSLKAIELVCTQERSKPQSNEKSSHKGKKGNKRPGTEYREDSQERLYQEGLRPLQEAQGRAYHSQHQGLS